MAELTAEGKAFAQFLEEAQSEIRPVEDAIRAGLDPHTAQAKRVFHVETPTPAQRLRAKEYTYRLLYHVSPSFWF
jgi:DNA polymerase I-like protein with 3'-5' exonuclease and polymerase domains